MTTQTPDTEITDQWTQVTTPFTNFNVEVKGRDAYLRIDTAMPTSEIGVKISEGASAPNNKDITLNAGESLYARGVNSDTTLIVTGE